jgi:hypothetical protein
MERRHKATEGQKPVSTPVPSKSKAVISEQIDTNDFSAKPRIGAH